MARFETLPNDLPVRDEKAVADADSTLWRKFAETASAEGFCSIWLALQCRWISGVSGAVVLLGTPDENQSFAPAAFWPDENQELDHLSDVAQRALTERRGIVLKRQATGSARHRLDIAYPIQISGRIHGVVALDMDTRPDDALRNVMRQLQWGAGWMEVLFHRGQSSQAAAPLERLKIIVSMLGTLTTQQTYRGAAVAFATKLATLLDCDRVSLGFVRRGHVQVEALSHSAQFGRDTNLMRAICDAMDETVDQAIAVVYPQPKGDRTLVTRGHAELARQFGNGSICSVPLQGRGHVAGAVTFERSVDAPFDQQTVQLCESLCALAGPILETHRREDRWLLSKVFDSGRRSVHAMVGSGHAALKIAGLFITGLIVFMVFATGEYRVTAKTVVEPATRQAVVAAFDGYVRAAPVKAGDVVFKGQLIATLDDRDLKLERRQWKSQEEQSLKQYYQALGTRNASQAQVFMAQMARSQAQVALLDEQLSRTSITAPFDGVLVSGDLSQSLGAPVERGQLLFEVAPLDAYRVILQVDERDIADVAEGQRGRLVLSGFPDEPLDFWIKRLTPVSTTVEGRNVFRVEAHLENVRERLRPGMEGVGKIEIDRRRLIWIWTHEVRDWLVVKTWAWLP